MRLRSIARVAALAAAITVAGSLAPIAASAAPSPGTEGCSQLVNHYEGGNPGITTASQTPYGYGACGFGTPGGPR
ncbi:MAG TPA: hypothetical protein VJ818_00140 [Actinomycetota bacterium]|nr:hypothetical protein [Actinomycetota bacterium]